MVAVLEFRLPLAPADLLQESSPGQYAVQEVLPVRDLPPALTGVRPPISHLPLSAYPSSRL